MNTLIIDCSNGLFVQIVCQEKCFIFEDSLAKKQSDSLLDKIDQLLKESNLTIKNIDVIAVNVGPGSFTGIRVAISTAKGLAIGNGAKVVTFNSFEAVDVQNSRNYGIIVEGFGNSYYYYFKKYGKIFQGCASTDKLAVLAKDISVFSTSEQVRDSITNFDIKQTTYNAQKCVEDKISKNQFIETNQIAPLYLRASQAELERLKNGNKI